MGNLHESLFTLLQLGLTYLVCAVVWLTLVAGFYQLVRDKLRWNHSTWRKLRRLAQSRQLG
jgi:uncharacterized membrane protein